MRDLATLERAFHALVVGDAPLATARDLVIGGAVDPADRMRVYAHAYVERIRAALAADHAKLATVLGDDRFAAMVRMYLHAYPTRHWSLREAGDRLAAFLAGDSQWPAWLADLARLERARVEVFDAADAVPLARGDLEPIPPEAFAALRLTLVPSAQLVTLAHAADETWATIEDERPWTTPAAVTTQVAVWRRDLIVIHRTLAADEANFLAALKAGTTFADACEAFGDLPDPAARALEITLNALDGGMLALPDGSACAPSKT